MAIPARAHAASTPWYRPGGNPAADREQLERVGELSQIAHAVHPVRSRQRLPAAVRSGQRARMRRHHRTAGVRAARGQEDHGNVAVRRAAQHLPQRRAVPDSLEHESEYPGAGRVSA